MFFFGLGSRVHRTLKERHNNRDGRGLLVQVEGLMKCGIQWRGYARINGDRSLGLVHIPHLALRQELLVPTVQCDRCFAMVEAYLRVQQVLAAAHAEAGW